MPAGPDETDNHAPGAGVEHVMRDGSSKTDNNASTHPLHGKHEDPKGDKVEFRYHDPKGPAVSENMPGEEGTKEERAAKTQELNK